MVVATGTSDSESKESRTNGSSNVVQLVISFLFNADLSDIRISRASRQESRG